MSYQNDEVIPCAPLHTLNFTLPVCTVLFLKIKDFKATFHLSSQLIIFVNDEQEIALKVFKRVKHLWVWKFHENNAFLAIASNAIILRNFNPSVFSYYSSPFKSKT